MIPLTDLFAYMAAELLNPKTALFFLAFLPQFVHAHRSAPFALGPLGRMMKRLPWLMKWQGKIIGSIFLGLGLKVAMQKQ